MLCRKLVCTSIVAVVLLSIASVRAENSVVVESRTFGQGQSACTVGVFLTNDVGLTGLVLPLEIRTLSGGAYMSAGGFSRDHNQAGRLANSPLGNADGGGAWPAAGITRRTFSVPDNGGSCARPADPTNSWNTAAGLPDFVSPDAVFHSCVSTGDPNIGEVIELPPGSDPPQTQSASYRIIFNVNTNSGQFEIDTTCIRPSNHLAFVDGTTQAFPPSFTKGIITIPPCDTSIASDCDGDGILNVNDNCPEEPNPGQENADGDSFGDVCDPCPGNPSVWCPCDCSCHADPECNGSHNVIDVILVGNRAFRGALITTNEGCGPHGQTVDGSTDVDCSGATDIVDVVKIVDVAFRGVDPETRFCDPCL